MSKIPVKDVTPEMQSLYQKREKIYMREVEGFFNSLRQWLLVSLMIVFYGSVWLKWDGRQAILFDLPARQFHIFGITFWPQDFMRSEEHTSELQSRPHLVCRLLLEIK